MYGSWTERKHDVALCSCFNYGGFYLIIIICSIQCTSSIHVLWINTSSMYVLPGVVCIHVLFPWWFVLFQHEEICAFPSNHFYGDRLRTANSVNEREERGRMSNKFVKFWPSHTATDYVPLVFCNVVGKEEELVVTSHEGHERSKSNVEEKDKVVSVEKQNNNYCIIDLQWSCVNHR